VNSHHRASETYSSAAGATAAVQAEAPIACQQGEAAKGAARGTALAPGMGTASGSGIYYPELERRTYRALGPELMAWA
jgi:hypothetical protein